MTEQRPAPDRARAGEGAPAAHAALRARVLLLLVSIGLVVHGSLYPWYFELPASVAEALRDLLGRRRWWTRWDDVIGNVVLFLPLGAMGLWLARAWTARGRAVVAVLASGVALALGLQLLQLFVPSRDAELTDVLWNGVGLVSGLGLALLTPAAQVGLAGPPAGRTAEQSAQLGLAAMLAVLWLVLHWWPFVPAISLAAVKGALLAVWTTPRWSSPMVLEAALGVLVIAELTRPLSRRVRLMLALCTLSIAGRLFNVQAVLPPSWGLGLGGGLALAVLAWRAPASTMRRLLFWAVVLWFVADGLRPYRLAPSAREFEWLPFAALLHGSMLGNLLGLCWNLFWLGAAVSLGGPGRGASGRSTLALMLGVAVLEGLQTRLPGRHPDITPALLPALWWLASHAVLPARQEDQRL